MAFIPLKMTHLWDTVVLLTNCEFLLYYSVAVEVDIAMAGVDDTEPSTGGPKRRVEQWHH